MSLYVSSNDKRTLTPTPVPNWRPSVLPWNILLPSQNFRPNTTTSVLIFKWFLKDWYVNISHLTCHIFYMKLFREFSLFSPVLFCDNIYTCIVILQTWHDYYSVSLGRYDWKIKVYKCTVCNWVTVQLKSCEISISCNS